jgi:hypothetical protein
MSGQNENRFQELAKPAFLILLVGMGLWFFKNLDLYMDLDGSDEAIYISKFIGPEIEMAKMMNAPIYSAFYALIYFFTPDRIQLFFTATKILLMLPAVCGFLFLIREKVHPAMAFSFCLLGMCTYMNTTTWPRIYHLYVALFSISIFLIGQVPIVIFLLRASVVLALATFLRPESAGVAIIALVTGVGLNIWINKDIPAAFNTRQIWIPVFITIFLLSFSFKSVLSNERDRVAFVQHYAYTKHKARLTGIDDPWINSTVIFKEDFSKSMTLGNAIKENPKAIWNHISLNIGFLFEYLAFFPGDLLVGPKIWTLSLKWRNILGISFLIGLLVLKWRENSTDRPVPTSHLNSIILFILVSIPLIGICLVFHPREHYLLSIFWFSILSLVLYLSTGFSSQHAWAMAVIVLLIFVLKKPVFEDNFTKEQESRKNLATVEELKERGFTKGGMIGPAAYYQVFLSPDIKEVKPYFTGKSLSEYLKWNDVKCIVVNRVLKVRSYTDTSIENLIKHPEKYGYQSVKPKNGGYRLLLSDLSLK